MTKTRDTDRPAATADTCVRLSKPGGPDRPPHGPALPPTVVKVSTNKELRDFLTSRRANVTPEQVGLIPYGDDRRVPGLRREEVAELAGVSLDYYSRLERGTIRGASESVLNAVARALKLTDVERAHLFDIAHPAPAPREVRPVSPTQPAVRASVQRVLDSLATPAIVYDAAQDLVAANLMGRALCSPHFEAAQPNMACFIFLDPRARDYYRDWPLARQITAAMLRFEAGRDPLNARLTAVIGELSTLSPHFRQDWAEHDVHDHRTGRKTYHHPLVGILDITWDVFQMPGQPGLSIVTYTAEDNSDSAEKLSVLASWAASRDDDQPNGTPTSTT